jgi:AhpD family alkylhydroperoxidase
MKNYSTIEREYTSGFGELAKEIPGPAKAFGDLFAASVKDGALSRKSKELIAFSIAIVVRCDGCIAAHSKSVLAAGATREEVAEMIGVAILMGGGPATVYGVEAMRAFDEFSAAKAAAE